MTLEAPQTSPEPLRATTIEYTALVTDEFDTVLDEGFDHPSARRDAVVELLLSNHDEVDQHEIDEILAPFGGADADLALALVVNLFTERGTGVTVTLGARERDLGPMRIYTAFTDYGDGSYWIEHYPTREARLEQLRQRAFTLTPDCAEDAFADADEDSCRKAINGALVRTRGDLVLIEALRSSTQEAWAGEFPDDDSI